MKVNCAYFRKIWITALVKLVTSVQQSVNGRPIIRLCTIVHYSCALFPYFTVAIYIFPCRTFLCCTFYMFHFFHTAPFPCSTFFCKNLCTSSCTLFMYCYISCWTSTLFNISILHSFPVALVACCTLFMLHYFQKFSKDPYKHLRWRTLQQQLTNPLNIVAKISILDVRRVLATHHHFHIAISYVAFFSCCTFLILKNTGNERKT